MKQLILVLFIIFNLYTVSYSQIDKQLQTLTAYKNLDLFGEVQFTFEINDLSQIATLTRIISIDRVDGRQISAYANRIEFEQFQTLGIDFNVITPEPVTTTISKSRSINDLYDWNIYPSHTEYVALLQKFETDYPDLCKLYEIGKSTKGRGIYYMKISDNVEAKEPEPEFLYTSTMHGDEKGSYILMLRLIDYLLKNYGIDTRITHLVNNIEIWINPLANPDGTYAQGDAAIQSPTRGNANNVDLNRNYADPWTGPHPDGRAWQAETVATMDFMRAHNFVLSANFHAGAELVNYPWDGVYKRHPDDAWLQLISRAYADTAHANSPSGYMTELDNGISNGADWYIVYGGRQDFMNFFCKGREVTIELDNTKQTPEYQLHNLWNYNYKSMLNYMEQCLYGIKGQMTDAVTGNPIRAKIEILNHDTDSSHIYSEATNGNYHRLIYSGLYDLQFTNYTDTVWVHKVEISNYKSRRIDVPIPSSGVCGLITNQLNLPLYNAKIIAKQGETEYTFNTDNQGYYHCNLVPGTYEIQYTATYGDTVKLPDFEIIKSEIQINDIKLNIQNSKPEFVDNEGNTIDTLQVQIFTQPYTMCFNIYEPDGDIVNIVSAISKHDQGLATVNQNNELCLDYGTYYDYSGRDTLQIIVADTSPEQLTDTLIVTIYVELSQVNIAHEVRLPDFSLTPNPASHQIELHLNRPTECDYGFKIYNSVGQEIESTRSNVIFRGTTTHNLDISNLQKGIYLLKIYNKNNQFVKTLKFIKN